MEKFSTITSRAVPLYDENVDTDRDDDLGHLLRIVWKKEHEWQCEVKECEFTFAGPAASVVQTMANIYKIGDQGKQLIEGTFEQIRSGAKAKA